MLPASADDTCQTGFERIKTRTFDCESRLQRNVEDVCAQISRSGHKVQVQIDVFVPLQVCTCAHPFFVELIDTVATISVVLIIAQ